MNKNFKEVIADIKQGEIWESEYIIIEVDEDEDILIKYKEGFDEDMIALCINKLDRFKLKINK